MLVPKMRAIRTMTASALAGAITLFLLAGCGEPRPTGFVAPLKPLSEAETALLKQIEDTPATERQAFMGKHRTEVMQFAMGNRAFGERMNTILGVKPDANSK